MIRRVLIGALMFVSAGVLAQVSNDNVEERLELNIHKPLHSSTAGANVQWKCINKALTNKCLVYHNDQWFSFKVATPGNYFINISSQACRDSKGIQMILIEGNPCEVSTYRIIECINQIRTEDVFVEAPSLKANTQYLVNVDGFLGDFCEFNIELSDKPRGLPRADVNLDTLKIESRLEKKVVTMKWTLDEKMARDIREFKVVRNKDVVSEIGAGRNAYGLAVNEYNFTDTLEDAGTYRYNIYGIRESDDMPLLLSQRKFSLEAERAPTKSAVIKVLPLRLMFKEHDIFQLRLYNYDGDHLLWKHEGESQGEGELFMIDPQPYVTYGLRKFQLLVLDGDGNKTDEIYFRVGNDGSIIKE
ncbi:MAG: hypothetical protein WDO14_09625 [Bacteroidota bacterium]